MNPTFLPHTVLDVIGTVEAALPSPSEHKGRERLRALRDQAIASGAHVLIVLWQNLEWTLLAIQPPADVQVSDAFELISNLMLNPDALRQAREAAREGHHLQWLVLSRSTEAPH
jgi:hypothetical protein